MKIDIHIHSKFSKRPSQWILKKIGCPECFTEPLKIYRTAKNHGMSHVTITDHTEKIMGQAARRYVEKRSFEAAFLKTWDMYYDQNLNESSQGFISKAG